MKYKKPQDTIDWLKWRSEGPAHALAVFLSSLPGEFEILGPGERAVVWPPQCNKAALNHAAALEENAALREALKNLTQNPPRLADFDDARILLSRIEGGP